MKRAAMQMVAVLALACCAIAGDVEISIVPEQGGVYSTGDEATWTVSVTKDGAAVNGEAEYILKSGGWTVIKKDTITVSNGTCTVVAPAMDTPGSLLLELTVGESNAHGGALFGWEKIQPSAPEPDDFDAFWKSKIKELEAVPFDVKLEKVDVAEDVDYWKITMGNIRGSKIHGQLAKPKNSSGKLPAMLQVQWAGVYPLQQEWVTQPAQQGWLAMNIIAHDLPIDREPAFYEEQKSGPLKDYATIGNENRDESYFLRMYLSCYRAVEYLMNRPDWDGDVLHVRGTSQGGMQGIMIAGLHPGVTSVAVNVPAGCDFSGEQVGRDTGWPKWGRWQSEELRAKRLEAGGYYDAVNFSRRIECPVLVGVGLIDETCPPEGVIAMFNQVAGKKRLVILPVAGHQNRKGSQDPFYQADGEWMQALKAGRPLMEGEEGP